MRAKLTKRRLASLTSKAVASQLPIYCWDTETKGFGVRISAKGTLTWQAQKWQGGRGGKAQRLSFQAKNLEDARKHAIALAVDVSKGIDLPSRKRAARAAKRVALQAPTLSEAVAKWIKLHSEPGRYWDELEKRYSNQIIPALGEETKLHELTKADLQAHLDDCGSPRLTYAALSPFLKWCLSRDHLTANPLATIQPPEPSKSRERVLRDSEIVSLWQATAKLPLYGNFYRLLLLTMQRREEVAGIELKEIDKASKVWTIPGSKTKNGSPHLVPLSALALSVIEDAELEAETGSPYLFGVEGRDGEWSHISSYSDAKADLDALLPSDMQHWTTHDLRRTRAGPISPDSRYLRTMPRRS